MYGPVYFQPITQAVFVIRKTIRKVDGDTRVSCRLFFSESFGNRMSAMLCARYRVERDRGKGYKKMQQYGFVRGEKNEFK